MDKLVDEFKLVFSSIKPIYIILPSPLPLPVFSRNVNVASTVWFWSNRNDVSLLKPHLDPILE